MHSVSQLNSSIINWFSLELGTLFSVYSKDDRNHFNPNIPFFTVESHHSSKSDFTLIGKYPFGHYYLVISKKLSNMLVP